MKRHNQVSSERGRSTSRKSPGSSKMDNMLADKKTWMTDLFTEMPGHSDASAGKAFKKRTAVSPLTSSSDDKRRRTSIEANAGMEGKNKSSKKVKEIIQQALDLSVPKPKMKHVSDKESKVSSEAHGGTKDSDRSGRRLSNPNIHKETVYDLKEVVTAELKRLATTDGFWSSKPTSRSNSPVIMGDHVDGQGPQKSGILSLRGSRTATPDTSPSSARVKSVIKQQKKETESEELAKLNQLLELKRLKTTEGFWSPNTIQLGPRTANSRDDSPSSASSSLERLSKNIKPQVLPNDDVNESSGSKSKHSCLDKKARKSPVVKSTIPKENDNVQEIASEQQDLNQIIILENDSLLNDTSSVKRLGRPKKKNSIDGLVERHVKKETIAKMSPVNKQETAHSPSDQMNLTIRRPRGRPKKEQPASFVDQTTPVPVPSSIDSHADKTGVRSLPAEVITPLTTCSSVKPKRGRPKKTNKENSLFHSIHKQVGKPRKILSFQKSINKHVFKKAPRLVENKVKKDQAVNTTATGECIEENMVSHLKGKGQKKLKPQSSLVGVTEVKNFNEPMSSEDVKLVKKKKKKTKIIVSENVADKPVTVISCAGPETQEIILNPSKDDVLMKLVKKKKKKTKIMVSENVTEKPVTVISCAGPETQEIILNPSKDGVLMKKKKKKTKTKVSENVAEKPVTVISYAGPEILEINSNPSEERLEMVKKKKKKSKIMVSEKIAEQPAVVSDAVPEIKNTALNPSKSPETPVAQLKRKEKKKQRIVPSSPVESSLTSVKISPYEIRITPELKRLNTTEGFWAPTPDLQMVLSMPNMRRSFVRTKAVNQNSAKNNSPVKRLIKPESSLLQHRKKKLNSLRHTLHKVRQMMKSNRSLSNLGLSDAGANYNAEVGVENDGVYDGLEKTSLENIDIKGQASLQSENGTEKEKKRKTVSILDESKASGNILIDNSLQILQKESETMASVNKLIEETESLIREDARETNRLSLKSAWTVTDMSYIRNYDKEIQLDDDDSLDTKSPIDTPSIFPDNFVAQITNTSDRCEEISAEVKNITEQEYKPIEMFQENNSIPDVSQENTSVTNIIQENNSVTNIIQENTSFADVIQENTSIADVIQENTSIADVIQENTSIANIMQENTSIANIMQENTSITDIIQENTNTTDIIQENTCVTDIIQDNISVIDILEKNTVADITQEDITVADITQEDITVADIIQEDKDKISLTAFIGDKSIKRDIFTPCLNSNSNCPDENISLDVVADKQNKTAVQSETVSAAELWIRENDKSKHIDIKIDSADSDIVTGQKAPRENIFDVFSQSVNDSTNAIEDLSQPCDRNVMPHSEELKESSVMTEIEETSISFSVSTGDSKDVVNSDAAEEVHESSPLAKGDEVCDDTSSIFTGSPLITSDEAFLKDNLSTVENESISVKSSTEAVGLCIEDNLSIHPASTFEEKENCHSTEDDVKSQIEGSEIFNKVLTEEFTCSDSSNEVNPVYKDEEQDKSLKTLTEPLKLAETELYRGIGPGAVKSLSKISEIEQKALRKTATKKKRFQSVHRKTHTSDLMKSLMLTSSDRTSLNQADSLLSDTCVTDSSSVSVPDEEETYSAPLKSPIRRVRKKKRNHWKKGVFRKSTYFAKRFQKRVQSERLLHVSSDEMSQSPLPQPGSPEGEDTEERKPETDVLFQETNSLKDKQMRMLKRLQTDANLANAVLNEEVLNSRFLRRSHPKEVNELEDKKDHFNAGSFERMKALHVDIPDETKRKRGRPRKLSCSLPKLTPPDLTLHSTVSWRSKSPPRLSPQVDPLPYRDGSPPKSFSFEEYRCSDDGDIAAENVDETDLHLYLSGVSDEDQSPQKETLCSVYTSSCSAGDNVELLNFSSLPPVPESVEPLAHSQPAPLTPPQPASLTPPQPASLTPLQPASLTPPQPASLTPPQAASLTPPQPASLTPPQPASLTPPQPASLTPPQPASLTPPQPAPLTPPQPAPLTPPQPAPLTPPQPAPLTPPQPASLTPPRKVGRPTKMKGRRGKPPGMPMTEEEKSKKKSKADAKQSKDANKSSSPILDSPPLNFYQFSKPPRTARKSLKSSTSISPPGPFSLKSPTGTSPPSTTFSLRKKSTRSPLEMLEMKRRQEEAIYDLEEERKQARRILLREKRFAKELGDGYFEEDLEVGELVIKPCSVVLSDFVKKLQLDSLESFSDNSTHEDIEKNFSISPKNIGSMDDDSDDEDWCADLEDCISEGEEEEWRVNEMQEYRPYIPRLKLKRVVKKDKTVEAGKKSPRSSTPKPGPEPIKIVIKAEPLSDSNIKTGMDLSKMERSGFEGSFVDFLKDCQDQTSRKYLSKKKSYISKPIKEVKQLDSEYSSINSNTSHSLVTSEKSLKENKVSETRKTSASMAEEEDEDMLIVDLEEGAQDQHSVNSNKGTENLTATGIRERSSLIQQDTRLHRTISNDEMGLMFASYRDESIGGIQTGLDGLTGKKSDLSGMKGQTPGITSLPENKDKDTTVVEKLVESGGVESSDGFESTINKLKPVLIPETISSKSTEAKLSNETLEKSLGSSNELLEDNRTKDSLEELVSRSPRAAFDGHKKPFTTSSPKHSTSVENPAGEWRLKVMSLTDKFPSGQYRCKRCDFTSQVKLNIESHIYSHIPGVQFRCAYCESEFSSVTATLTHLKNTHTIKETKLYISRHIEEKCFYEKDEAALPDEPTKSGKPQAASVATGGQSPPLIISLVVSREMSSRSGRPSVPPRRFVCTHCGFYTSVKEDADHHKRDLHISENLFACLLCNENIFSSEFEIKQHSASVHPKHSRSYRQLPDYYEDRENRDNIFDKITSLLQGDKSAQEHVTVDHRQKAKDYLFFQDELKEKTTVEADSTTAVEFNEDNIIDATPSVKPLSPITGSSEHLRKGEDGCENEAASDDADDTTVTAPLVKDVLPLVSITSSVKQSVPSVETTEATMNTSTKDNEEKSMADSDLTLNTKETTCTETVTDVSVNCSIDESTDEPMSLKIVQVVSLSEDPVAKEVLDALANDDSPQITDDIAKDKRNDTEDSLDVPQDLSMNKHTIHKDSHKQPVLAGIQSTTSNELATSVIQPSSVSGGLQLTSMSSGIQPLSVTGGLQAMSVSGGIPSASVSVSAGLPSSVGLQSSSGGLPLSYKCNACKVHTPYLLMMVKHLKAKHPNMRCFACPYCKAINSFSSQKQLRHHVRNFHPDKIGRNEIALSEEAKKFVEAMVLPTSPECIRVGNRVVLEEDIHTCTYCQLKMTSLAQVYEHLNNKHSDLFEFVCPVCQSFKSKILQDISVHCIQSHNSPLDTDKVHVSVPKSLFHVLSCISKGGKYIEKSLNDTSSKQPVSSAPSLPVEPAPTIQTPLADRNSHSKDILSKGPIMQHLLPAVQQVPSVQQSLPHVVFSQTPLIAIPLIPTIPTASAATRPIIAFSSALFDTSSLSSPPELITSMATKTPSVIQSTSGVSSFLAPGFQQQGKLESQGKSLTPSVRHPKSKQLPVLNVPNIKPRMSQSCPVIPLTSTPDVAHRNIPSKLTPLPVKQISAPVREIDNLPETDPDPDAFKIFNLRPSGPVPPPPSSPSGNTAMVFPPVSSSVSTAFIQGPIAGFPSGMVVPQSLVPYTFSHPQQMLMASRPGLHVSKPMQPTSMPSSEPSRSKAKALFMSKAQQPRDLLLKERQLEMQRQQRLVHPQMPTNPLHPATTLSGPYHHHTPSSVSVPQPHTTDLASRHSEVQPSGSSGSSLAPAMLRPSKGVHKRSSSTYQCPYCPQIVTLKALEVASHIQQYHPGSQVTFKKVAQ